jgi:hypothetical protein
MDVQPEVALEQVARDQAPVRDQNDRLGVERPVVALDDGDAELQRGQLRGRRPQTAAAPSRRVGLREYERDLVPRRQSLEDLRPERRSGGQAEPGH